MKIANNPSFKAADVNSPNLKLLFNTRVSLLIYRTKIANIPSFKAAGMNTNSPNLMLPFNLRFSMSLLPYLQMNIVYNPSFIAEYMNSPNVMVSFTIQSCLHCL
jgi:hypothetical protein